MMKQPRSMALALAFLFAAHAAVAQVRPAKVIIDTDVGDDVDDAFAIDLALASPEIKILGLSSAWGDTALRARMLDRLACETGRGEIAVQAGIPTKSTTAFSQAPWAKAGRQRAHGDAVTFLLDQIKAQPGEITLLALGPLTNIGAAFDRDPQTFRKLKRVVLMGGSIYRGYGAPGAPPEAEYNIARDPGAAQKLFRSDVPILMLPLDSTQLKFDEPKRSLLATVSTPMTDALQVLIAEWHQGTHGKDPTLFDAVAAAYVIEAQTCPMVSLHIEVDEKGMTRPTTGAPNAQACLKPQEESFFALLMPRLLKQRLVGTEVCLAPSTN
ncbi:inosine-uridine nucleoside N-ribohydrolase [Edaphobacter modestus]|uniref:Inosine-uridine nucleoside N-ribohydrolase n=2 Tax=Edaphobacter modestus TaxID=388466 RepID=A0A4V2G4P1_9BACT|nr:inosine-uridine nucleoside N-ribohydrolase [Edaphobacter modestus]